MRIGTAPLALLATLGLAGPVAAQDSQFVPLRLDASRLRVAVPQRVIDRQYLALSRMQGVEVEYTLFGSVSRLKGHTNLFISPVGQSVKAHEPANEIFATLSTVLAAKGTEMLIVRVRWGGPGWANTPLKLLLEQTTRGWTVRGGGGEITIEPATGEIVAAELTFVPDYGLPAKPKIGVEEASRIAAAAVESPKQAAKGTVNASRRELQYYCSDRRRGKCTLVWEVYTFYRPQGADPYGGSTIILVDAIEGRAIESGPVVMHATGADSL